MENKLSIEGMKQKEHEKKNNIQGLHVSTQTQQRIFVF